MQPLALALALALSGLRVCQILVLFPTVAGIQHVLWLQLQSIF
jgi:hypothetical protein